jgi:hypothetical protein
MRCIHCTDTAHKCSLKPASTQPRLSTVDSQQLQQACTQAIDHCTAGAHPRWQLLLPQSGQPCCTALAAKVSTQRRHSLSPQLQTVPASMPFVCAGVLLYADCCGSNSTQQLRTATWHQLKKMSQAAQATIAASTAAALPQTEPQQPERQRQCLRLLRLLLVRWLAVLLLLTAPGLWGAAGSWPVRGGCCWACGC